LIYSATKTVRKNT